MRENEHLDYHQAWEQQRLDSIADRAAEHLERFQVPTDEDMQRRIDDDRDANRCGGGEATTAR